MLQDFINLIFPKKCIGCEDVLLNTSHFICVNCLHKLDLVCAGENSNPTILSRFYGKLKIEYTNALLYYDKKEISHKLIHQLKYKNKVEVGIFLANLFYETYHAHPFLKQIDEIIPVPLHHKKEKERGYNQLDSFGERLAELTEIPYNKKRLTRNFYTSSQTKKNIFARSQLKTDLFTVNYTNEDHGKHFLIIDDVVTTGSTIEKLGNELLKIPKSKISTFFMTYTK